MSALDHYGEIADHVRVAATSTAVRDADEALGRGLRTLAAACDRHGGHDYVLVREAVLSAPSYRVRIMNTRHGGMITERSSDPIEAVDTALDRLNREAWDR